MKPRASTLKPLAKHELAWIAGLLEGEGSFGVMIDRRANKLNETLLISCAMTDRDVIQKLQQLTGIGCLVTAPAAANANKPMHRWRCYNNDAHDLMRLLLPLMGQRRSKTIQRVIKRYEAKLQRLSRFVIRHLPTGRVEEPYELKSWCREHGIPFHALKETLLRGRQPIDGYVREQ